MMKQIVIQEKEQIQYITSSIPKPTGTQVLIRVETISLCGSDLHLFHGTYNGPMNYPLKFGHEWSGEVVSIGPDVKKIKIKDMVTGDCSKYCGKCKNCQKDKNMCTHIEKFGITIDGASAEYIIRDEQYLYAYDPLIGFDLGALVEPLAVSRNLLK